MVHPWMQFIALPPSLAEFTIQIEKEVGRILVSRYGLGVDVGPIRLKARDMAKQAGRHRPTPPDNSSRGGSSSSSSSDDDQKGDDEENNEGEVDAELSRQQEAYDDHHDKVDRRTSGKSQHGKFKLNCFVNDSAAGEHFHLYYRNQTAHNDGQHTGPPDVDDDCALPLLKEVVKEVTDRFLTYGGLGQVAAEYDLRSNNVFENTVAREIYESYGNAGENSNAEGRGEGGGQLPMTAASTYKFFCKLYGVEWGANSWQRVTQDWPYPAGVRIGVIGIGYGEEWILLEMGRRAINKVFSDVPPLHVVGFEIDPQVSKQCDKNIHTLGVQEAVRCFTADFLAVGVIAEFETSLVAHFQLSFLYTTAAVNQVFALHVYTYAIQHGLVLITDQYNSKHFEKVYNDLFPYAGRAGHVAVAAGADARLRKERMPAKMCDAYVGGGSGGADDVSSKRPIFVFDCRDAVLDADVRSAMVRRLAPHIKTLTVDIWKRSKGSHDKGFCGWINKILEPRHYRGGKSFSFLYQQSSLSSVITLPSIIPHFPSSPDRWYGVQDVPLTTQYG